MVCLPEIPRGGVVTVVFRRVGRAVWLPGAAERLRRPLLVPWAGSRGSFLPGLFPSTCSL